MKKWLLIIIIVVVLGGGYFGYNAFFGPEELICPEECDDKKDCTEDTCGPETNFTCSFMPIVPCNGNKVCERGEIGNSTDCPDCEDNYPCSEDVFNFKTQECGNFDFAPCNGNSICEKGEYDNSTDCPDCNDDDNCTSEFFDYELGECVYDTVFFCCGNNICEIEESYLTCKNDCDPTYNELLIECGTNDKCRIDVILEYGNPTGCMYTVSLDGPDLCTIEFAQKTGNLSLCPTVSTNLMEAECYEKAIVSAHEIQDCLRFLEYPNDCIEGIAIRDKNQNHCNNVIEEPGFWNTISSRAQKCAATVTNDYTLCKFVDTEWISDSCYLDIAIALNDTSVCESHSKQTECEESVI